MRTEERTFVAVKPDGVQRGLVGEIIKRFETKGYKIVALKMIQVTDAQARAHYEEHKDKPFFPNLIKYLQSGPIVAMVVQGYNAVAGVRHLMGSTVPDQAEVGTIRADFAQVKEYNIVHGSDSLESAEREIKIYFTEDEICKTSKSMSELVVEHLDA